MDIGSVIGGYRLEALIGRGGMGVVYRAMQVGLDRVVALKVIAPELGRDEDFRLRFAREGRLAATVDHPNIVPIYDFGQVDDMLYLAMRYVAGRDLSRVIEEESPLEPARVGHIIAQVAAGLGTAHERGFVHRDIKPANILVTPDDHVYLTDFGLATRGRPQDAITGSGMFVGTTNFVAPEQISGRAIDARADQYSLGGVLFTALTGRTPFERDTDIATLFAHVNDDPPEVTSFRADVSAEFDQIVARAMAKEPDDRYPTVGDLGRAALAAAAGASPPRPSAVAAADLGTPSHEPSLTDPQAAPRPPTHVSPAHARRPSARRHRWRIRRPGQTSQGPSLPPRPDNTAAPESDDGPPALGGGVRFRLKPGFTYVHHPLMTDDPVIPLLGNETAIQALAERIQHSLGGSFLVTGFRGVGKSTVVLRAVERLRATSAAPVVQVHLNVARPRAADELLYELIRRLFEVVDDERLFGSLPTEVHRGLMTAYERTRLTFTQTHQNTRERAAGVTIGPIPIVGSAPKAELSGKTTDSASTQASFLTYTEGDVEQDFMRIMRLVRRPSLDQAADPRKRWRSQKEQRVTEPFAGKIVVILDELDKLTDRDGPSYIEELLRTLKNLFTAGDVHFVFVAGPDLHEAALRDRYRGNSVYDSVFAWELYVPCVWDAPDAFLKALVVNEGSDSRQLDEFANYLRFKARGVPRLLLKELNEFVRWHNDRAWIELRGPDLARVIFYAEIERVLAEFTRPGGAARAFGVPIDADRWHLGAYYLADAILRTGGASFTAAGLLDDGNAIEVEEISVDSHGKVEALCKHFAKHEVLEISSGRDATATYFEDAPEAQTLVYKLRGEIVAKLAAFARVDERERAEQGPDAGRHQPWAETGAPPRVVGTHYEVLEELDRAGVGRVYRARDRRSGKEVAVKMLDAPQLAGSPAIAERFKRNAALAKSLVHPNVVRMLDTFTEEKSLAIVMELVDGTPLRKLIDQVRIRPADATTIALGLLDAIEYLSENGIVRCDLKPSSIMLDHNLKPVILDLGIAKRMDAAERDTWTEVTRTGVVIGTPAYLAPEQITGQQVDVRSDLFTGPRSSSRWCQGAHHGERVNFSRFSDEQHTRRSALTGSPCHLTSAQFSAGRSRAIRTIALQRPRRCAPHSSPPPTRAALPRRQSFPGPSRSRPMGVRRRH